MELLGKSEIHFSVFNWVFFSFQLGIFHQRDRWNLLKRHLSDDIFNTAHSNSRSSYSKRLPVKVELLLEKILKRNRRVLDISTVK